MFNIQRLFWLLVMCFDPIMNSSLCNYFSSFDEFWSSLQLSCNYDLSHPSIELISHGVFLFFTTLYICLVAHATKIVTLQLHQVPKLPIAQVGTQQYEPLDTYLPVYGKTRIYYVDNQRIHLKFRVQGLGFTLDNISMNPICTTHIHIDSIEHMHPFLLVMHRFCM